MDLETELRPMFDEIIKKVTDWANKEIETRVAMFPRRGGATQARR